MDPKGEEEASEDDTEVEEEEEEELSRTLASVDQSLAQAETLLADLASRQRQLLQREPSSATATGGELELITLRQRRISQALEVLRKSNDGSGKKNNGFDVHEFLPNIICAMN